MQLSIFILASASSTSRFSILYTKAQAAARILYTSLRSQQQQMMNKSPAGTTHLFESSTNQVKSLWQNPNMNEENESVTAIELTTDHNNLISSSHSTDTNTSKNRFNTPSIALTSINAENRDVAVVNKDDTDFELILDGPRSLQWKKPTESLFHFQHLSRQGFGPRQIMATLYPRYCSNISDNIPDTLIMQLLRELCEQRTRQKLLHYNTFEDAIKLFRQSKRIMVITGAGVSVSCGIPDFRSENGIYARLKKDFPELPTPSAMFDIDFFRTNPKPFYNFAREIFPGQYQPSLSHMFIKFLEEEGKLLRNYSQNIDTLERVAGITNLIECHGSFASASCLNCGYQVNSSEIREQVFAQRVAHCSKCDEGVMKPNIVFFGEDLGDTFHDQMGSDHVELDLLVVIGSSMQVRPVSLIPFNIAPDVPQILINRELLNAYPADIKLLGSCDAILTQISLAMGGSIRRKMLDELQIRREKIQNGGSFLHGDFIDRFGQQYQLSSLINDKETEIFLPRKISIEEFKQSINAPDQHQPKHEEEHECVKKLKFDETERIENLEQEKGETSDKKLCQGNYVSVEAYLPSIDSYLLVPPNINVFNGAKMFYDRDRDIFVHRMGIKERQWGIDNADDNGSINSFCSDSESSSSHSGNRNNNERIQKKANSCPPTFYSILE